MALAPAKTGSPNTTHRDNLLGRFSDRIAVNHDLTRQLVSWQSNKKAAGFRWFKFKEGFSTALVDYLFQCLGKQGRLLDPFAGTGCAPLTAASNGWQGVGIEILPIAVRVADGLRNAPLVDIETFRRKSGNLLECVDFANAGDSPSNGCFPHVRITEKAFPAENERAVVAARDWLAESPPDVETELLTLAALSVLEDASWTSKDGQYLRWDHRSGRNLKARMEKRRVLSYAESLRDKLSVMADDLPLLAGSLNPATVEIIEGSCHDKLKDLPADSFDAVVTSPPYANRYDYTRTYALELAWLGFDDAGIGRLRQRLLSATVENQSKREQLSGNYGGILELFDGHPAINEIVTALEEANIRGELPNPHVIRLVSNYCLEMAVVIAELARVCKPGASVFMVNDNVQYHGEEVPVDLILSDLAEQCGFKVNKIWTLARGKGNASQQMGRFGRRELRKCVYWWERR